ncbi:hypothetical protein [Pantoea stewartii]|uniref:hypothetical protein n=1 Tax=Pantoea stewartii TaxID=66269 RepID=UPI0025A14875|nr:hypothetical protein [Pantoea stewartii]
MGLNKTVHILLLPRLRECYRLPEGSHYNKLQQQEIFFAVSVCQMNADAHKASVVNTLNLIMSFILLQADDLTPIHSHSDNRTVELIIYLADMEQQNI